MPHAPSQTVPVNADSNTADSLPVLELSGLSPQDRGRGHGETFRTNIEKNVETYLRRFEAGGLDRNSASVLAERWGNFISEEAPDYADEMRGISEGANLPFSAISLLNARYEMTYGVMGGEARATDATIEEVDGCTAFGLLPEATANGATIIGQNWDWLENVRGNTFIMRVMREDKPDFVGFTEAGIVGCKMGVNEHGIGLCVNGLITPRDGRNGMRRPLHVRCRDILDATRFDLAIGAVVAGKRTCSSNILIGDAGGEIINIEALPDGCAYIYPTDGIVTHANHLVAETNIPSLFEQIAPHSLYRGPRLDRLLRAQRGRLDVKTISEALSDKFGHPAAICRHPDPLLPEAKRVITVASIVTDLASRTINASAGPLSHSRLTPFPLYAA